MNLFGKKKQAPPPRLQDTIQQLRDAQVTLEKRERHIEKQAAASRDEAKVKLRQKNKGGALLLIKRAKMYDKEIAQIYGKRANLDVQILALEGAASNAAIFSTMVAGKNALKAATQSVDVDQVSDVMEDITESIQMNDEVNEALSQQIGPQLDEDELKAELDEMEQELVDQELLKVQDITAQTQQTALTQPVTLTTPTTAAPITRPTPVVHEEHKAAPALPARVVLNASGSTAQTTNTPATTTKPTTTSAAPRKHNIDDKEAKELKELQALMDS